MFAKSYGCVIVKTSSSDVKTLGYGIYKHIHVWLGYTRGGGVASNLTKDHQGRSKRKLVWSVYKSLLTWLFFTSSRDNMLPNHLRLNSALTCRLVGGLTREQRTICHESPDAATIAFEGLQLAVKECQHQFRWHRWNCSSLAVKGSNPHTSGIMKRGELKKIFSHFLAFQ